jgi:membrane protein implicated in regulation of membrane protease activity
MTWFLIFASVVFSLYFWLQYRNRQAELNSPTAAHRLGLRHIGHAFVLEQPLQNGAGRIELGGRQWAIRGPNLPIGSRVRVTGVDGSVLLVDRLAA